MNRLRRKKLFLHLLFLLLFVVLCRSFWPLYFTSWGAQRAFQRQYHWGAGTGGALSGRRPAGIPAACLGRGYRSGSAAALGALLDGRGQCTGHFDGEKGLLYSWRSWGGEEYELVVYGKAADNRISQVEVEFLTGETRRQKVTSEGGFLLVESRGTSDDFYVKTIRGLDEKGNIITEDVIIKR